MESVCGNSWRKGVKVTAAAMDERIEIYSVHIERKDMLTNVAMDAFQNIKLI